MTRRFAPKSAEPADLLRSARGMGRGHQAQPALLAMNLALTELWQHWVRPTVVVGHSLEKLSPRTSRAH